jgi:hypothetical protein
VKSNNYYGLFGVVTGGGRQKLSVLFTPGVWRMEDYFEACYTRDVLRENFIWCYPPTA